MKQKQRTQKKNKEHEKAAINSATNETRFFLLFTHNFYLITKHNKIAQRKPLPK